MILLLWFNNANKSEQLRKSLFRVHFFFIYYCILDANHNWYRITFTMQLLLKDSIHYNLQVSGNSTVGGIDYFVTDAFGEGLYESCKEVKFGTMNSRALQFIGAGAQNFKGKLYF